MRHAGWDGVILGLDVATVTGWCVGHTQCAAPEWGTYRVSSASDADAALSLARWLRPVLTERQPGLVAKETAPPLAAFSGKTNAITLRRLCVLGNKVEELCLELGIPCYDVDPTQWRKPLTGEARFPKTRRPYPPIAALEHLGFDVPDHNAADAFGVWLYALALKNVDAAMKFHPLSRETSKRRRG